MGVPTIQAARKILSGSLLYSNMNTITKGNDNAETKWAVLPERWCEESDPK